MTTANREIAECDGGMIKRNASRWGYDLIEHEFGTIARKRSSISIGKEDSTEPKMNALRDGIKL